MSDPTSDRSIHVSGNVTRASLITGDHNRVTTSFEHVRLPAAADVDIEAELAALRAILEGLDVTDRGKAERALTDATEEAAKEAPDKPEVAGALERAVRVERSAADFAGRLDDIQTKVVRIAGWLGPVADGLLSLVGLCA